MEVGQELQKAVTTLLGGVNVNVEGVSESQINKDVKFDQDQIDLLKKFGVSGITMGFMDTAPGSNKLMRVPLTIKFKVPEAKELSGEESKQVNALLMDMAHQIGLIQLMPK